MRGTLTKTTIYFCVASAIGCYLWCQFGLFTYFSGDLIDTRFNQVILEHFWLWTQGRVTSLSDPPFYYPYRDVLFLSDTHLGTAWIYALFRALTFSREIAFDLWVLTGYATTFASTLYVLRRFSLPAASAAVGALLFTFALPLLAHDDKVQFVYRFAVPLATLALIRFIRTPRFVNLCAVLLWVCWQYLCSIYLGVFLSEWLIFVAAFAFFCPSLQEPETVPSQRNPLILLIATTIATILTLWMLWRYAQTAHLYAIHKDVNWIKHLSPPWTALLSMRRAPTMAWLAPYLAPHDEWLWAWQWEHQLCPGPGAISLAIAGFVYARREKPALVTLLLVSIVGMILFHLNTGPYAYFSQWPGFNAIRGPARFAIITAFPLAWLASLGVTALSQSKTGFATCCLALGLAVVDIAKFNSWHVSITEARARVARVTQGYDTAELQAKHALLLSLEHDPNNPKDNKAATIFAIDAMLAAQDLGLNTTSGYTGTILHGQPIDCGGGKILMTRIKNLPRAYLRTTPTYVLATVPAGSCEGLLNQ